MLVTAAPLWDQIIDFVHALPGYWDDLTPAAAAFQDLTSTAGADDKIRNALKDLAAGLPDAATALLGISAGVFGSLLSLVTLTFLSLFLLMERPTITDWLFGFAPPEVERALAAGARGLDPRGLLVADRQRRDLDRRGARSPALSAWALGLPFPIVLAVITGFLDLIPQVGATIAAVILVAVALTVSTPAAIGMAIIQLDLPAGRELHRLPDRVPPGGRALGFHHDRRGADRGARSSASSGRFLRCPSRP